MDGAIGRSEVNVLGGDVSFFGFLAILLLRCSPLAMSVPWIDIPVWEALDVKAQSRRICGFVGHDLTLHERQVWCEVI